MTGEKTYPVKNQTYAFDTALLDSANTRKYKSTPTLAAGDIKISIDNGALVNITALPTSIDKIIHVELTAAEMNGDLVTILFSDPDDEWCDSLIAIRPSTYPLSVTGFGSIAWPYTLTDDVGNPVEGASIWACADAAGTHKLAYGLTDVNGQVIFMLDPGTIYIWGQKDGYSFNNPDTEVVS